MLITKPFQLSRHARALALGIAVFAPAPALSETVTVFAAASLTTALAEIEADFEAATGHDLVVSLAG